MMATKIKGPARYATYPNISPHALTTTMHHLSLCPRRECPISRVIRGCQDLVRFFALLRIKPHAPPLVRAPVNSFEFQPCGRKIGRAHGLNSSHVAISYAVFCLKKKT